MKTKVPKGKVDSIKDPMGDAFIKFFESQGYKFVDVEVEDEKGKKVKIRTIDGFIPKTTQKR